MHFEIQLTYVFHSVTLHILSDDLFMVCILNFSTFLYRTHMEEEKNLMELLSLFRA